MFVSESLIMAKLLMLILCFHATSLSAQVITGTVKDGKGHPVAGATIALKDSYDGSVSDAAGAFSFQTVETGAQVLQVTAIGYRKYENALQVQNGTVTIHVVLKEEVTELKAVVISAGSFEASDRKKGTVLNSIDIVTTASANADVTGAVKTLPGAQQVGESEGLFVRGGTAAETKTYIDGTLVNNFFYSSVPGIAQRGRFSPFIFKGTVFSAGGYSALYGQALSSALILESIDMPEQASASVGLTVIGGNAGIQTLSKNKRSSFGVTYGYTNLALAFSLVKQDPEYYTVPSYHNADANFRIRTSATGILKYYGYFSANKLGLRRASIDTAGFKESFALKNSNHYHNLSYRENIGRKWKLLAGLSFSANTDDINASLQDHQNKEVRLTGLEEQRFIIDGNGQYLNGRLVMDYRLKGLSALRFGAEYNHSRDRSLFTRYDGVKYPSLVKEQLLSAFGEADIYVTNSLAAKAGLRTEYSQWLDRLNLAPRLSLAYKLGNYSQASMAYGVFYQNPERRFASSIDALDFAKATHYIAQFQQQTGKRTLRAELFYKQYEHLVRTTYQNNMEVATGSNGTGDAKGFELFWRDKQTIKNFDYWVSYSYLDTKRQYLNFPVSMRPSFAATHTSSLVLKKFVTPMKSMVNTSYTYASGRPYYHIRPGADNKFIIADAGRTIDYHSLSLSVNYLPNVFKKGAGKYSVLVFSWTNVLGTKQVFGYRYAANGQHKEAIMPPSRSFLFLGAFISFGIDRTEEVINANL